ncbi:hypothetical protein ABVF61_30930 [Roseibium sp. HPY-6]|uniref:hypothetical protein n=1 Tax=Roseibium sp. HPY-6 TaxID=3229852 RepID=UPI00338E1CF4
MSKKLYVGVVLLMLGLSATLWTNPVFFARPQIPQLYVALSCDAEKNPFSDSYSPNLRVEQTDEGWQLKFLLQPFGSRSYSGGLCSYDYFRASEPFSIKIEASQGKSAIHTAAKRSDGFQGNVFEIDFERDVGITTDDPATIVYKAGLARPLDRGRLVIQTTVGIGVDGSDNDPIRSTPNYVPVYLTVPVDTPILETTGRVNSTEFLLQAFRGETPVITYAFDSPTPFRAVVESPYGRFWNDVILLFAGLIIGAGFTIVLESSLSKLSRIGAGKDQSSDLDGLS